MANRAKRRRGSPIRPLLGSHAARVAFGRKAHPHTAGFGQEARIEWLNRMGVDRTAFRASLEQACQSLRDARIEARRGDTKAHAVAFPDRIDRQHAAARYGLV